MHVCVGLFLRTFCMSGVNSWRGVRFRLFRILLIHNFVRRRPQTVLMSTSLIHSMKLGYYLHVRYDYVQCAIQSPLPPSEWQLTLSAAGCIIVTHSDTRNVHAPGQFRNLHLLLSKVRQAFEANLQRQMPPDQAPVGEGGRGWAEGGDSALSRSRALAGVTLCVCVSS